jgi:hypothetical protein
VQGSGLGQEEHVASCALPDPRLPSVAASVRRKRGEGGRRERGEEGVRGGRENGSKKESGRDSGREGEKRT